MKGKNKPEVNIAKSPAAIERRRRKAEGTATAGMLLLAAALVVPFAQLDDTSVLSVCKWFYAAGALIFTVARVTNVSDPRESLRLRRLRRLEFWAGMAFCIGAFLWFYNEHKFGAYPFVGSLTIIRDTILFSLVGALIQLIASWMIYFRQKKELGTPNE